MKKFIGMAVGLVLTAGLACADVSYNVSGQYATGGTGQTLTATNGTDVFTLVWTISGANNTVATFPSNENFGEFILTCTAVCDGASVTIPTFEFVITINDTTDGGIGTFTGDSAGGPVAFNTGSGVGSSNVVVSWTPTQLGPGTTNLTGGTTFGPTVFTIVNPTPIVDPSTNAGIQTISGVISSAAVPEPATFGVMGAALLGLGFIARKRKA